LRGEPLRRFTGSRSDSRHLVAGGFQIFNEGIRNATGSQDAPSKSFAHGEIMPENLSVGETDYRDASWRVFYLDPCDTHRKMCPPLLGW